jgi:NAD(P)-dependent dehydrogenase (short-subunit alcohol dehydrogenase family)
MKKVAFITGAGGYIGSETAFTLAQNGVKVAVCDINSETVFKTFLSEARLIKEEYPKNITIHITEV